MGILFCAHNRDFYLLKACKIIIENDLFCFSWNKIVL